MQTGGSKSQRHAPSRRFRPPPKHWNHGEAALHDSAFVSEKIKKFDAKHLVPSRSHMTFMWPENCYFVSFVNTLFTVSAKIHALSHPRLSHCTSLTCTRSRICPKCEHKSSCICSVLCISSELRQTNYPSHLKYNHLHHGAALCLSFARTCKELRAHAVLSQITILCMFVKLYAFQAIVYKIWIAFRWIDALLKAPLLWHLVVASCNNTKQCIELSCVCARTRVCVCMCVCKCIFYSH